MNYDLIFDTFKNPLVYRNVEMHLYELYHKVDLRLRRILRCNCSMPYSKASAVGGQPGT